MSTNANPPSPATPLTGPDGRLSPEWWGFFLALFNRTGANAGPLDAISLEKLDNGQVSAPLLSSLLARVAVLEQMIQSVVPVMPVTPQVLPDLVAPRQSPVQSLPDLAPVPARDPTTDLYKRMSR